MKSLIQAVALAAAIAAPIVSFAQSKQPVTRDIQAAEVKIAAQDSQQEANSDVGGATTNGAAQASQQARSNDVGGTTAGASASGSAQHVSKPSPSSCTGPASYCNLFFGN
ncbi:DUF4148 domain-containing protein [Paraburkholderia sp. MMS20-SJTN17]|uniref:DUF4148 domain-containing protein n=1 Tax=Paraburkholderia translucens TaxID=2886945 RepID=A0ABS8K8R1_9BURK|nr:DUF4148 domain-containing protein [Paraburkholderia sp. MMS20-SJTN17]MCC8400904.1 DUF4148 domain-containing protein [Paraburkholderia sp. MMS20-SJTN17]